MAATLLPSLGFSGAGFLGCYHVGVAACLQRHGWIPNPNSVNKNKHNSFQSANATTIQTTPLLTGVSAGSMVAAACRAGVEPDPDGMEVVLTAARRSSMTTFDALTPGYSLIDAVEESFRNAIVKALDGSLPSQRQQSDDFSTESLYDIDPELFQRRFSNGSLRIGLTDKRSLLSYFTPLSPLSSLQAAYRYVDSYRNVEDVVASCLLSSYIPGITGPLLADSIAEKFTGRRDKDEEHVKAGDNDALIRAGRQLHEMTTLGFVKDGRTGLSIAEHSFDRTDSESNKDDDAFTQYWDGGIADMFPIFDDNTVIVAPVNGTYTNPAICPTIQQPNDDDSSVPKILQSFLPVTFRHCSKSNLGLNVENAQAMKEMLLSSDEERLYLRFRCGYDDATRYLNERCLLRVFKG